MKNIADMILKARANDSEPVFVLRARDNAALPAARAYLNECMELEDVDMDHVSDIERIVGEFEAWRTSHQDRCKDPD